MPTCLARATPAGPACWAWGAARWHRHRRGGRQRRAHRLPQARDPAGQLVALKLLHPGRATHARQERAMLAHELAGPAPDRGGGGAAGARRCGRPGAACTARRPRPFTACSTGMRPHAGAVAPSQRLRPCRGPRAWRRKSARLSRSARGGLRASRHQARQPAPGRRRPVAHPGPGRCALAPRAGGAARLHAGTPSYINPEQWGGPASGRRRQRPLRTRRHALPGPDRGCPMARSSPTRWRASGASPLRGRLRPDVPIWLARLVSKAVGRDDPPAFQRPLRSC